MKRKLLNKQHNFPPMDVNENLLAKVDIPQHLAFNKYILNGYRVNYSIADCIKSLFHVHNETVNIYSHGLMVFYLLMTLPWPGFQIYSWHFNTLLTVHCIASIFPFLASTLYHLFMCHKEGAAMYKRLLCFDMVGVWAVNTFGYIIAIVTTFQCYLKAQVFIVALYLSLSIIALYYLVTARDALERFIPLTFYAVSRPLIVLSRLCINNMGIHTEILYFNSYVLMDLVAIIGAVINVCKFPERFRPGSFDIFLNSHQIMHLCSMGSILFLEKAVASDMHFLSQSICIK